MSVNYQAILDGFTKAVAELPTVLNLAEEGTTVVMTLVNDFKTVASNPTTTQADIDALVTDIQGKSAAIQAIP